MFSRVFCVLMVASLTFMNFAESSRMCEHLRTNIDGKKVHCCFDQDCCGDIEDMCRKIEVSETRLEILLVQTSNVACNIMEIGSKVCCDNRIMECNCPDGYVMCSINQGL